MVKRVDGFVPLREALAGIGNQPNWYGHRRLKLVRSCWESIVGAEVVRHSYPTGVYHEVLQVAVASAVWAQELSAQRSLILDKINKTLIDQMLPPCKEVYFSTRNWHGNWHGNWQKKTAPPQTKGIVAQDLPPPQTAIEALERFARSIKVKCAKTCPQCQRPTSAQAIAHWGVCRFCARANHTI